jgi:hypothetical protein
LCDLARSEIYLELNLSDEAGEPPAARSPASMSSACVAATSVTNAIAASHDNDVPRALQLFERARTLLPRR